MEVEGVYLEVKGWRRWRLRKCSLRLNGWRLRGKV